jgi:hypothetical protein
MKEDVNDGAGIGEIKPDNALSDEYSVRVAKSIEEVEQLRPIWEKLQRHPNGDIDQYLTVLNSNKNIVRPHVIVINRNGNPSMFAVGRLENRHFNFKVGYKSIYNPVVRALTIVYGGVLGDTSQSNCTILVSELIKFLRTREADVAILNSIEFDSELFKVAGKMPGIFNRDHNPVINSHWKMAIPKTIDHFLENVGTHKKRNQLKRYQKVLEKEYPGDILIRKFTDVEQVQMLCNDVEEVAKKTYQRGLGVGFSNNYEDKQLVNLSVKHGWLRGYVLYIKQEPIAFWLGNYYGGTFYINFTGYDPKYSKYDPGMVLFLKVLEDLCEIGAKNADFGFGDAFYKKLFSDVNYQEATVYIFAVSLKGLMLNGVRILANTSSKIAGAILRGTKVEGRIRKIWRDRIRPVAAND